jgi:hypothetical protein
MEERYAINTESSFTRSMGNTLSRKNDSFIKVSTDFTIEGNSPNHRLSSTGGLKESQSHLAIDASRKGLKVLNHHPK